MRGAAASGILAVWKRAAPRNRMREIFTSGSVGGLVEQSPALPGRIGSPPRAARRSDAVAAGWVLSGPEGQMESDIRYFRFRIGFHRLK